MPFIFVRPIKQHVYCWHIRLASPVVRSGDQIVSSSDDLPDARHKSGKRPPTASARLISIRNRKGSVNARARCDGDDDGVAGVLELGVGASTHALLAREIVLFCGILRAGRSPPHKVCAAILRLSNGHRIQSLCLMRFVVAAAADERGAEKAPPA